MGMYFCDAKTTKGTSCKGMPLANGFCSKHGGNDDSEVAGGVPAPIDGQPDKRKIVKIRQRKDEAPEAAQARALIDPVLQSAMSRMSTEPSFWNLDVNALHDEISKQVASVNAGDMSSPEAMLIAQAYTLDSIFNNMARRAFNSKSLEVMEKMMGMSMKAQSQCRTTLQTLVDVKYPRTATFIKQANIANQQQVNNGVPSSSRPPAGDIPGDRTNQLLTDGSGHGQTVDGRGAGTTISVDKELAAVGKIDRAKNARRKSRV